MGRESDRVLLRLLRQLRALKLPSLVVINHSSSELFLDLSCVSGLCDDILVRPNEGMNIGAWRFGAQAYCDMQNYHFFQSECFIKRPDFLERYTSMLENPKNGIVGDSLNLKWNYSWKDIESYELNFPVRVVPGEYTDHENLSVIRAGELVCRVPYYRRKLRQWRCPEGDTALHLRALNWSFRGDVFRSIDFPVGFSKHECIAAEIAVSRMIASQGLLVRQSNINPFYYVGHDEWMNLSNPQRKSTIC